MQSDIRYDGNEIICMNAIKPHSKSDHLIVLQK